MPPVRIMLMITLTLKSIKAPMIIKAVMAKHIATTTRSEMGQALLNNGSDRLLTLLQIANASFPTGAFTHSYGFEVWVSDGAVETAKEVERRCRDWMRFNLTTCDAVAVALSFRVTLYGDMAELCDIDRCLNALKLTKELRQASTMTGTALITAGVGIFGLPKIKELGKMQSTESCAGHHAVAYGVLAADLGLTEHEAVVSFLWSGFSNLIAVLQRQVPLAQADAQRIIADAGPFIESCAEIARVRTKDSMSSSYAALDMASMQHERLDSRLCIS